MNGQNEPGSRPTDPVQAPARGSGPPVTLRLTWNPTTDVAYLLMAETMREDVLGPTLLLEPDADFAGGLAADFTLADGRLVGLEFQRASACLPPAWLAAAEAIPGEHAGRRFEERLGRRLRAERTPGPAVRPTH